MCQLVAASPLRQSIRGYLLVEDQAVHVKVELPWLLAVLAGPVKREVERHGRRLLTSQAAE
jgi:hypothetical protein